MCRRPPSYTSSDTLLPYRRLFRSASFTDRLADCGEDGIDLAIRSGTLPDSGGMVARALGRQLMVVCASPAYVAKYGKPRTLRDLDSHHAVMYKRNGQIFPWTFHD